MLKVGYIGLGLMGKSIARNIHKAGFPLVVHNRSRAAVDELTAEGASPAEGVMRLELGCAPEGRRQWLRGVTDMLLMGLRDLDREHPGRLKLEVGEEPDGT